MRRLPVLLVLVLAGCVDVGSVGDLDAGTGYPQTPPTGHAALTTWLAAGHYQAWRCEAVPHGPREPSAHHTTRVCSNELLSGHGDGVYPVGAANVKEIFSDEGSLRGHAVYRHVTPGAGGETWYWYEALDGVVAADGLGDSGKPASSCVSCHEGAGPAVMGHDLVYTQVR